MECKLLRSPMISYRSLLYNTTVLYDKDMWNPPVGEKVNCEHEGRNPEDPYTVTLRKDGVIVGHVPRTISCICTIFLRQGGEIQGTITGPRKHSNNLPQGGLELPCTYQFNGPTDVAKKAHLLSEEQEGVSDLQGSYMSTIFLN